MEVCNCNYSYKCFNSAVLYVVRILYIFLNMEKIVGGWGKDEGYWFGFVLLVWKLFSLIWKLGWSWISYFGRSVRVCGVVTCEWWAICFGLILCFRMKKHMFLVFFYGLNYMPAACLPACHACYFIIVEMSWRISTIWIYRGWIGVFEMNSMYWFRIVLHVIKRGWQLVSCGCEDKTRTCQYLTCQMSHTLWF